MKWPWLTLTVCATAAAPGVLLAASAAYRLVPETNPLRSAPGIEPVVANCALCHSLDYVSTQPPKMGREFWQATVTKMVNVYGAEIAEPDKATIVNYLVAQY